MFYFIHINDEYNWKITDILHVINLVQRFKEDY